MGPVFASAKKTFYVLWFVRDKNQRMECAVHNFKEWSVLCTKSPFGDVPQTNFPFFRGVVGAKDCILYTFFVWMNKVSSYFDDLRLLAHVTLC